MKQTHLKKQLIKTAVVCGVILLVAGGILFGTLQYEDHMTAERDNMQSKATSTLAENATLKQKIAQSSESYVIYKKIIRYNKLGDFSLNRDAAAKLLDQLKHQYPLSDLQVTIAPVQTLPPDVGKKKTGKVVYSEVHIVFNTTTDTMAFQFIGALGTQFPGFVIFQSIKLQRKAELSAGVFQDILGGHIPSLVSGDLTFDWLGIRPDLDAAHPPASPAAPAAGGPAR